MKNYLMEIDNLKPFIIVAALLMLSCLAVESGQANSFSQHLLEQTDRYMVVWNRSDIGLESGANNRRPSMVGAPGKIILNGSMKTGPQISKLIGLDSLTGDIVWTTSGVTLGEMIYHDKNIYIGTYGTAMVQSINIEDGKLYWEALLPLAHSTSDIYFAENKIFVNTNNAKFFVLSERGDIIDSFSETNDIFLQIGGILYMEDVNGIKAVDFSSKKELWHLQAGAVYSYAPIFDNGTMFFRTAGSPADIYSVDRVTGNVNWKTTDSILSNLYVTDNKIYFLNSDSCLISLDRFTGNELLKLKFSPPFNLNGQNTSYFISGDSVNNMLVIYFGDNSQILALKVLNP